MTDLQAAVGVAQVDKLPDFGAARRRNFAHLSEGLTCFSDVFDFAKATPGADPSWFGFLMTVREDAPFDRAGIVDFLEANKIQTRVLFAGNLVRHPCFDEMREAKGGYRVVGDLPVTDRLMERAFWVGVYPGMTVQHLDYMAERVAEYCGTYGLG
jgi:CDP-6-deoxy-D-xylo-4-hexulose-3-dehydrase